MKLTGPNKTAFSLTIVGYQYPAMATARYDSNWLDIHVEVTTPQGTWSTTDPCLLTYEVRTLADWLDAIDAHKSVNPICSFIEPCLRFELHTDGHGQQLLRISFEQELRPPWAQANSTNQEDIWIEFPLTTTDIARAVQSLRAELERYPQRAEV